MYGPFFDDLDTLASLPRRFSAAECGFAYRDSRFKSAEAGQWLITRLIKKLGETNEKSVSFNN